jgi:cysteine synthase
MSTVFPQAPGVHPVQAERLHGLQHLVGNTPLLEITFAIRGRRRALYVKLESQNMTGSIKDRLALHVLASAYRQGAIKPGDRIAEATSGNTGISFAAIGRALGHPVTIFMPDWMSQERIKVIASLGADITLVSRDQGGFLGSIRMAEELARQQPNVFLPRQFSNQANVEAHEATTAVEIWSQLALLDVTPDAFVAGVGTGGTVMGVGRFFKRHKPTVRIHPLEPAESPTLSTGCKVGHHRIQGISDEFIPPILKLDELDAIIKVSDGDSILMAQKLTAQLGLRVGISSGANFIGALLVQQNLPSKAVVVTVFADDNSKYLSTDLLREEAIRPGYIAPEVTLLGFKAISRGCTNCSHTTRYIADENSSGDWSL